MRPEIRKIVREMRRKGWALSFQGNGHPRLTHPSGRYVSLSLTPSDGKRPRTSGGTSNG